MFRKSTISRPGSGKSFWQGFEPTVKQAAESYTLPNTSRPHSRQNSYKWRIFRPISRNKQNSDAIVDKKVENLSDAERIILLRHSLVRLTQSYEDLMLHKFLRKTFYEYDSPFYFPWTFWYTEQNTPILEETVYRQTQLDAVIQRFDDRGSSTLYLMRELATPELCYIRVFFRITRSYEKQLFPMIASMAANGTLLQPQRISGT